MQLKSLADDFHGFSGIDNQLSISEDARNLTLLEGHMPLDDLP